MDFSSADIGDLLSEFDKNRLSMHLSYQNVADACDVSTATIFRIFKRQTEPTMDLMQKIAIAVMYDPSGQESSESALLSAHEDNVRYLQEQLEQEKKVRERQLRQQAAHYNMLLKHERRTVSKLWVLLTLLVAAFIIWLIVDITHPTVGWIQREIAWHGSFAKNLLEVFL